MLVTPYIKSILEQAGWFQGRQIDVDFMNYELAGLGYRVKSKCLIDLFREFWNLNIEYKTPDGHYGNIRLNIEVASDIEAGVLDSLSNYFNAKIVPVGEIDDHSGLILASESCLFYLLGQGRCFLIGDSFFEMLSTVVYRKDMKEISFRR